MALLEPPGEKVKTLTLVSVATKCCFIAVNSQRGGIRSFVENYLFQKRYCLRPIA